MKISLKKPLCALLCASMFSNIPLGALSYTGLGEVVSLMRDTVGDGLYYSELKSTDTAGKSQLSYIFEYDPSGGTLPIVRWGNAVYGSDRLGTLVSSEVNSGNTVFGALNGDFYSLKTGVPLGVMIDGGKIISTDDSKYALGFTEDGTPIIGKPMIKMSLTVTPSEVPTDEEPDVTVENPTEGTDTTVPETAETTDDTNESAVAQEIPESSDELIENTEQESKTEETTQAGEEGSDEELPTETQDPPALPSPIQINHINKYPSIWGIYLLTSDFSATTKSTIDSREIVIEFDTDITASCTTTGTVRDIIEDNYNNPIPEGCTVITAAKDSAYYSLLDGIKIGDSVTLNVSCAEGWENVTTAIGGGDMILDNGVMPSGIIDEDHEKIVHPRTAVGIKADGNVIFFAVDGRTASSRGLKIADLSTLMAELGCVTALNLDGGGSTTVMVKGSDQTDCVYVNVPADTSYRGISNGILFLSKLPSDGVASALSVYPNTPYVLSGSTVSFSAQVLDTAYMPLGITIPTESLTAELNGSYDAEVGSVSGGTFKAGDIAGEYRLKLSSPNGDSTISGDVSVLVIDEPDTISISPSRIKIKPGSSVNIDIEAEYNGKSVIVDSGAFEYTLNGTHIEADQNAYPGAWLMCDLGYLDINGNFQSFGGEREGTVEIDITRGEFTHTVTINIGTTPDIIADYENTDTLGALRVGSDISDLYINYTSNARKSAGAFEIGFAYENANGVVVDITPREEILLSPDAESIKMWINGETSGNLYAVVLDENAKEHTIPYATTKDYSKQRGWREITAVIPDELSDSTLYLSSLLTVSDTGNAARSIIIDNAQITYGGKEIIPLTGISTHWAAQYIYTLYDMDVIEDIDCEIRADGIYYSPDSALTRGEFAKMLSLWLGLDVLKYADNGTALEDSTPADKVPYIRAIIDCGLMSGRGVSDGGKVIFDAGATITREEAFKVIGSLIDSKEGTLNFADSDKIADWARAGIAKCISKGIIKGYEDNTVRPKANISRAEFATILSKMA